YSSSSSSQKLIPALSKDARLTAISVTKEKHYVAVAETTSNSILVQILGLPTFRRRKSINVSEAYPAVNRTPKDIVGISFSSDSKYMAVITGDLFLSYWIWEKSRLTAKILVSNDHIEYKFVTVLVNPIDENLLSVYGRGLIRLYRLSEKELIPIPLELPIQESEVHSFSWLSAIRFTIGGCGN
ncbi:Cilia- and flagella-associated protein 57, partial [Coelomomyces lativittatus]